jgi:hypothetical protein
MAGERSNVPDRDRWPDGRLARIESGELDGRYMLVAPETAGEWRVYIAADPETTPEPLPYLSERGFHDDADLETALAAQEFSWVRGKDEALIEQRVFGLREAWRQRAQRRRWLRPLRDLARRRPPVG